MQTALTERGASRFVECLDPIARPDDALDIVSACASHGTDRVLLTRFHDDFFDLSTTLAGAFIQKLQNYRIIAAAVFPNTDDGRFGEFVREAKCARQFRAFDDRSAAEAWLLVP